MIFGLGLVKFGSGQARVKFFQSILTKFMDGGAVQAKIIGKMVEQCMSNQNVVKFWSLGLDKITPRVARVSKIIVRVGLGWQKGLGSGFDPTHS